MGPQRRSDRIPVSLPATVRTGGRSYRDVVTDLSETGLYLQGELERLRPGTRVVIAMSLPTRDRTIPVEVEGEVARVVRDMVHRTKGVGVRFVRPKPATLDVIRAFLAAREATAPPAPKTFARYFESDGPPRDDGTPEAAAPRPPPPRRYTFSAEAPDLDDDSEDTDPGLTPPEDDPS